MNYMRETNCFCLSHFEINNCRVKQMKYGFVKTKETAIGELDATLIHFKHEKTGLELVWLKREEENKTFAIAFETLPKDDTGVFHILEHSTLCGSKKYPLKDPFVELMKGSMNTFLNAMTFPDKTVYPVSSKNDKDFMNLVSVYLDAVFCPLIYENPEIFKQEGWHFEIDEDGFACYNGVVFNEMKGVYSDPDELSENLITESLFPDTPYHFAYGGDPAKIPDLTYEDFLDAHRKFYSPSNAYVFLDGSVNLDAVLKLLDEEYLSKFDKSERLAPPALQNPLDTGLIQSEYEVSSAEDEESAARLIYGNVIGRFFEREKIIGMQILADVLCGTNSSPLSKAMLSEGLADDVIMTVQGEVLQPYVKLEIKNISPENAQKAEKILFSQLKQAAQNGIDSETLEAAISNLRFKMMERDDDEYPQGVMLCFQALESWLYGGDPAANLEVGELFDSLESKSKQGFFENLIQEVLIDNPHRCKVLLTPSHELGEKRARAELDGIEAKLSEVDENVIQRLRDEESRLAEWQTQDDSQEILALMPRLTVSDIDTHPEQIPTELSDVDGVRIIKHPIGHNGLCYCNLYFDVSGYEEKELCALSLACDLFAKLETNEYSAEKLINATRRNLGSLNFSVVTFAGENEVSSCSVKLCVSFSALKENIDAALRLVIHILNNTVFSNTSAISDIIRQRQIELYQEIMMSGSSYAISRLAAASTVSGVVDECCSGIAYYQYLKQLSENTDFSFLDNLIKSVICKGGLVVSFTGDIPDFEFGELKEIPSSVAQIKPNVLKPWGTAREGFIIPADISFAAMGSNIVPNKGVFSSRMSLASHIISLDYLWNAVRVQGGAYGTGFAIRENGFCGCYSYRDPSAAESLKAFENSGVFLKEILKKSGDLSQAIIGTISDSSPLLSVKMKGNLADSLYFKNIGYDDLCGRRKMLLECNVDNMLPIADLIEKSLKFNSSVCVIGPQEQIKSCADIEHIAVL